MIESLLLYPEECFTVSGETETKLNMKKSAIKQLFHFFPLHSFSFQVRKQLRCLDILYSSSYLGSVGALHLQG